MKKRITALLLSLCMLFAYVPALAQSDACVSLSAVSAYAGETVDVELKLSGCAGFANLGLEISYDSSVMTLISIKENDAVGAVCTTAENIVKNPFNIGWDSTENTDFNGTLATLTFRIADDALPASYPVRVSYYKGRNGDYIDGESVNYDSYDTPLDLCYQSGTVKVLNSPVVMPEPTAENTYNGNVYMVLDRYVSWEEAKKLCEESGGHLATITSHKENDFVMSLCNSGARGRYYLGAYQVPDNGIWRWTGNENFVYTNWLAGESDKVFGNAYLVINSESGKWECMSAGETSDIGFVCEWEGNSYENDSSYWVEFESQKSVYAVGEEFEVDVWLYTNDSVVRVYDYDITGFNSFDAGTYNVTVSYGEFSRDFTVEVRDDKEAEETVNRVVRAEAYSGAVIAPNGYSEVKDGTVMKFVVGAAEGYIIDSVFVNGDMIKLSDGNLSVTVDRDTIVEAYGRKQTFTIDKTVSGNGYVELTSDVVEYGNSCTARFVADKGYIISDVKIDGKSVGVCKLYTFTDIKENHNVEVVFEKLIETITVKASSGVGGSIYPSRSVVNKGSGAVFTVTADYGYHFAYAEADGKRVNSFSNMISIDNLTENTDVYAVFEKNQYSVSVTDTEGAKLEVAYNGRTDSRVTVPYMDIVQIEVSVDDGYKLNTLYVNSSPVKAKKSGDKLIYTFSVTSNTAVSARCGLTRESEFSREVASFGLAADINASNAYSKKESFTYLADKYAALSEEEKKGCSSAYATVLSALERANAYIDLNESGMVSRISQLPSPEFLSRENYNDWKYEIDNAHTKYESLTNLSKSLIDFELVKKLSVLKEKSDEFDKAVKGEVLYLYELIGSVLDDDELSVVHSKLLAAENAYHNMSDETKSQVSDDKYNELISKRGRVSTAIQKQYVTPFTGRVLRCPGVVVSDSIEEAEEKRAVIYELMNEYHSFPSYVRELILPSTVQRLNALYESASIKVSATVNNIPVDMNGDFDESVELVLTESELDSEDVADATGKEVYQAIDVKMYSEDKEVQPSSKIRIKMEINKELSESDIGVVYIDDSNMVYDVHGEVIEENGRYYIVFYVDHFSNFAIVYNETEQSNISIRFNTEYAEIGDLISATVDGAVNVSALSLFVVGYSKNGAVTFVEKGTGSVEASVAENTDVVKAMLWHKNFAPVVKAEILDIYGDSEESDVVLSFNVGYAQIGDAITATVTGGTESANFSLFVAGYSQSGNLTFVKKGNGSVNATIAENTKTVKAMLWDNNMAPVVKPEILEIHNLIEEKNISISFSTDRVRTGDTVEVTASGDIDAANCILFAAGYSASGALTFVEKGTLSVDMTIAEDTETVKAMLWSKNMAPLSVAESLTVEK